MGLPPFLSHPQNSFTHYSNIPNKRFFERDVNGVREYFRKRFGYECAGFPTFDDLERDDNLDIEVACSGFTKQMEKDLLQEYHGMESESDDEESDKEDAPESDTEEAANNDEELNRLRQQVDAEVKFSEEKANERDTSKAINFNIQNYIASLSEHPTNSEDIDVFEDALEAVDEHRTEVNREELKPNVNVNEIDQTIDLVAKLQTDDAHSVDGNVSSGGEDDDELADLDPKSREYRFKMVEKVLSDARSQRSYSTSASTIAPSVVKDRIKKTLNVKEKKEQRKRCVVKGEASAVTRVRNENRDTCKQYAGWDF